MVISNKTLYQEVPNEKCTYYFKQPQKKWKFSDVV